jgi:chromosome segregation ATPase
MMEAGQAFERERNGLESIRQIISSKSSERQTRHNEIASQVEYDRQNLVNREYQARQNLQAASNSVQTIVDRLRNVEQLDLPRAQNELTRLTNNRPALDASLRDAKAAASSASVALDQYKAAVGYDAKLEAANKAYADVSAIKAQLASIDKEIKRNQTIITNGQTTLENVRVAMEKVMETIRQKESRSDEVRLALEPYEKALFELNARKAQVEQAYNDAKAAFAAML